MSDCEDVSYYHNGSNKKQPKVSEYCKIINSLPYPEPAKLLILEIYEKSTIDPTTMKKEVLKPEKRQRRIFCCSLAAMCQMNMEFDFLELVEFCQIPVRKIQKAISEGKMILILDPKLIIKGYIKNVTKLIPDVSIDTLTEITCETVKKCAAKSRDPLWEKETPVLLIVLGCICQTLIMNGVDKPRVISLSSSFRISQTCLRRYLLEIETLFNSSSEYIEQLSSKESDDQSFSESDSDSC